MTFNFGWVFGEFNFRWAFDDLNSKVVFSFWILERVLTVMIPA